MAIDRKKLELANKVLQAALKLEDAAERFRDPRLRKIRAAEDAYNMKPRKRLSGRFNYPLPIVSGFVDTLKSKIDNEPNLNFKGTEQADYRKAAKIEGAWRKESTTPLTEFDVTRADLGAKHLSIFQGRGNLKFWQDSLPRYQAHIEVVDSFDLLAEPRGGGDLERHRFKGQQNIERSKFDLEHGVKTGLYDPVGVRKMTALASDAGYQERASENREMRENRFRSVGLNVDQVREASEPIFLLTEMCLLFEGEWYHIVYSKEAKAWVRFATMKESFGSTLSPWISFATHEDPFNFWSKAVVDDLVPVAESMTTIFNQALTNRWRQNKGVRAFDDRVFEDPAELKKWMDDGIIPANIKAGGDIRNAVYEFRTPEINGTLDLFRFCDDMLGQKTGITAGAQGVSDKDTKASVYFGDMQQVADRIGLLSRSYGAMWKGIGMRYVTGLREHMPEKMMVKMIGENGVEWDEMRREDTQLTSELDISITGVMAENEANELKARARREGVDRIAKDPLMRNSVAPAWLTAETMRAAGFSDEEIRNATNKDMFGKNDELSRAAEAIQKILAGDNPKTYRGATGAFIQKILDFATDNEVSDADYRRLIQYGEAHFKIAAENAARNAWRERMKPKPPAPEAAPPEGGAPAPGPMVPHVGNEMAPAV